MKLVGIEESLIEQIVDCVPRESDGDQNLCEEILEEKIVQGGSFNKSGEIEYVSLGAFAKILSSVNSRTRAEFRTMTEMRGASDGVIECYESDSIMFYRTTYEAEEQVFDLTGSNEGESYYQCRKDLVDTIIAQACMIAHIAHIYEYKMSAEGLARVLLMLRIFASKECKNRKATFLLKHRACLIIGRAVRHILENHYPEIARFDILQPSQLQSWGLFSNDLAEEIITAVRREIAYVRRMEIDGVKTSRVISGF